MNQNTRALYDYVTTKNRNAIVQKPAQYVLDPISEHRLYKAAGSENIDTDSDLRMKPTRLNYFNRPETELYGTAPYMTLGHRGFVDVESELRGGTDINICNKPLTETMFPMNGEIKEPLAVDTALRPSSTRVNLRNSYSSVSGRAHDVTTHDIKN